MLACLGIKKDKAKPLYPHERTASKPLPPPTASAHGNPPPIPLSDNCPESLDPDWEKELLRSLPFSMALLSSDAKEVLFHKSGTEAGANEVLNQVLHGGAPLNQQAAIGTRTDWEPSYLHNLLGPQLEQVVLQKTKLGRSWKGTVCFRLSAEGLLSRSLDTSHGSIGVSAEDLHMSPTSSGALWVKAAAAAGADADQTGMGGQANVPSALKSIVKQPSQKERARAVDTCPEEGFGNQEDNKGVKWDGIDAASDQEPGRTEKSSVHSRDTSGAPGFASLPWDGEVKPSCSPSEPRNVSITSSAVALDNQLSRSCPIHQDFGFSVAEQEERDEEMVEKEKEEAERMPSVPQHASLSRSAPRKSKSSKDLLQRSQQNPLVMSRRALKQLAAGSENGECNARTIALLRSIQQIRGGSSNPSVHSSQAKLSLPLPQQIHALVSPARCRSCATPIIEMPWGSVQRLCSPFYCDSHASFTGLKGLEEARDTAASGGYKVGSGQYDPSCLLCHGCLNLMSPDDFVCQPKKSGSISQGLASTMRMHSLGIAATQNAEQKKTVSSQRYAQPPPFPEGDCSVLQNMFAPEMPKLLMDLHSPKSSRASGSGDLTTDTFQPLLHNGRNCKSTMGRSFDIMVSVLEPESRCRSPILLVIYNSTEHSQVRATLTRLAETQLELLSSIMPQHAIQFLAMESCEAVPKSIGQLARKHTGATMMFMDIVGFTTMSKSVEPVEILVFLNTLFSLLDGLTNTHGVHKTETAGDCYIVSGGVMSPTPPDAGSFGWSVDANADPADSARRVMGFAKALLKAVTQVYMPRTTAPVQVRVGMHTGDVVSGLIGSKLPKFSLFGDTMNTASRMESTGKPGRIHVSATTHKLLLQEKWEATGGVEVKGKGRMQTYLWLPPDQPSSLPIPPQKQSPFSAEPLPCTFLKTTHTLLHLLPAQAKLSMSQQQQQGTDDAPITCPLPPAKHSNVHPPLLRASSFHISCSSMSMRK